MCHRPEYRLRLWVDGKSGQIGLLAIIVGARRYRGCMKMPAAWMAEASEMFIDAVGGYPAPRVMSGAASALCRDANIDASVVECQVTAGSTLWKGVFIAGLRFVYVTVTKNYEGWSAGTELQRGGDDDAEADAIEAWAVPLSALARVELVTARVRRMRARGEASLEWTWQGQTRLVFDSVEEPITLPLFDHISSDEHEQRIESFLDIACAIVPNDSSNDTRP